jgi:uncharacterized membrane protein
MPDSGSNLIRVLRHMSLAVVFGWFFLGGTAHFTNSAFFVNIMPPYIPFPLAAVYVSGALEIAFALGILFPPTRRRSGNLLMALTVAVTPANIHMWLHPELFPEVSPTLLSVRLLVQALLLALIWWSTRASPSPALEHAGA